MFFCEFLKIRKNTFFAEHQQTTASDYSCINFFCKKATSQMFGWVENKLQAKGLTLAALERGRIVPAGSVSRPQRVNQQSYELEMLWISIKFYFEERADKKDFVGQVHFAHPAFY